MPDRLPRILLGCPTCDLKSDSLLQYMEGLNALTYPHMDVAIEDNSVTDHYAQRLRAFGEKWEKSRPGQTFRVIHSGQKYPAARARLVHGRNILREMVLNEKYDYFLSLEQDVILPEKGIETLLHANRDVVSGTYVNKETKNNTKPRLRIMAGIFQNEEEKQKDVVREMGFLHLFPSRLIPIAYAGLGCMLIRRRVLESISFRYDENALACDDVYFCQDARKKGFSLCLDSNLLCAHHFNDAFKKTPY